MNPNHAHRLKVIRGRSSASVEYVITGCNIQIMMPPSSIEIFNRWKMFVTQLKPEVVNFRFKRGREIMPNALQRAMDDIWDLEGRKCLPNQDRRGIASPRFFVASASNAEATVELTFDIKPEYAESLDFLKKSTFSFRLRYKLA